MLPVWDTGKLQRCRIITLSSTAIITRAAKVKKDRVVKRTLYRGSVIGKLPIEKYYEACYYPLLIKIARFLQGISIHNHPKLKVFLFASLNKVCTTPILRPEIIWKPWRKTMTRYLYWAPVLLSKNIILSVGRSNCGEALADWKISTLNIRTLLFSRSFLLFSSDSALLLVWNSIYTTIRWNFFYNKEPDLLRQNNFFKNR